MAGDSAMAAKDLREVLKSCCPTVLNNAGDSIPTDSLFQEGKYVALYFSAHWCPPCRSFTPKLVEYYNKHHEAKNFEIIFVSSDRDESSCKDYFSTMPWLRVPFVPSTSKEAANSPKAKLSSKYKVTGIPCLILFDGADGSVITRNAREALSKDPEAEEFPWKPLPLTELLKGDVINGTRSTVRIEEETKDKVLGIYFSAHWCPPCRAFTPTLVETYKKLKAQNKQFEIIFVSSDKDEAAFDTYFSEMPWLALPYDKDRKRASALTEHFNLQGIPTLVILDENKDLITKNGRGAVQQDPEAENFPWIPQPLSPLLQMTAAAINETPALLYLTGGKAEEIEKAKVALQEVAEKFTSEVKAALKAKQPDVKEMVFLYQDESDESQDLAESLCDYLRLPSLPLVAITNIQNQQLFVEDKDLSKQRIEEIVQQFKTDTLPFTQIEK